MNTCTQWAERFKVATGMNTSDCSKKTAISMSRKLKICEKEEFAYTCTLHCAKYHSNSCIVQCKSRKFSKLNVEDGAGISTRSMVDPSKPATDLENCMQKRSRIQYDFCENYAGKGIVVYVHAELVLIIQM